MKLIRILSLFILILFAIGSSKVFAEYYIVTEPFSEYSYTTFDSPAAYAERTSSNCGECSSYHPRRHRHYCHSRPRVIHHRHHCYTRHRTCNRCGGCMYTSTHFRSTVYFQPEDQYELDLDRRTADDVRADLQIND